jgi:uncharacterized OB-fold protein
MTRLPHAEPPDDELTRPFWDAVARSELRLPRCSVCGRWQWYPDPAGTDCAGGRLEWVEVATTGRVHTLTTVRRAFLPDGRDDPPFVVGFVELDGVDGVRLVANLDDDPKPSIGARVRARFDQLGSRLHPVFALDQLELREG